MRIPVRVRICVPILLFHIEKLGNSNIDFLRKTDDSKSSVLKRVHGLSVVHEKVWYFVSRNQSVRGQKGVRGLMGERQAYIQWFSVWMASLRPASVVLEDRLPSDRMRDRTSLFLVI